MADVRRTDDAYVIDVDGQQVGAAYFVADGNTVVFTHTEVDDDHEGEGLGSQLIKAALDDVRSRGEKVVPRCPFVAAYIRKHDEYQDLIAST